MSADRLPETVSRLIGQHPASIRTVCWSRDPHQPGTPVHLEIETKHGFVVLIDQLSGRVYANPPTPPDLDVRLRRWQQDLTERVGCAFAGRPKFATIKTIGEPAFIPTEGDPEAIGWYFGFDTGTAFTLTPGDGIQIVSR